MTSKGTQWGRFYLNMREHWLDITKNEGLITKIEVALYKPLLVQRAMLSIGQGTFVFVDGLIKYDRECIVILAYNIQVIAGT